ncbi:23S rRNA (pseudouridine(1915)-N(3))-methyltransferase RlmH [Thermodesulfobacterium commune]|uniref:23S rRNA (pseudouridine(1915)-N(3))-methyltransferase RlmH n=1 Tax=Thermodesulfobacterium commune TaxID=1741 RepID=UPI001F1C1C11|nr:23S rRNA (pseudouridine(1915)-N(3))-methyltransferase RlmH [Thermodesulfobacterium commune]
MSYYAKKIAPLCPVEVCLPRVKGGVEKKEERLRIEKKVLEKYFTEDEFLVILDERGQFLNTIELASKIEKWLEASKDLCFLVGGPEGISPELKNKAHFLLSLSSLTLNHEIAILVLMEALYRSFTILKKIPYHRA